MVPEKVVLKGYAVPFLSSKFVLGSTLPSGLIVRFSGSCTFAGNANNESIRVTRIKAMKVFICYQDN